MCMVVVSQEQASVGPQQTAGGHCRLLTETKHSRMSHMQWVQALCDSLDGNLPLGVCNDWVVHLGLRCVGLDICNPAVTSAQVEVSAHQGCTCPAQPSAYAWLRWGTLHYNVKCMHLAMCSVNKPSRSYRLWDSTSSQLNASTFTPRLANSATRIPTAPSSVVHCA